MIAQNCLIPVPPQSSARNGCTRVPSPPAKTTLHRPLWRELMDTPSCRIFFAFVERNACARKGRVSSPRYCDFRQKKSRVTRFGRVQTSGTLLHGCNSVPEDL